MPLLQPSEYDASYFDGRWQALRHNAGYSEYRRQFRTCAYRTLPFEQSTGNNFGDVARWLTATYFLHGEKVLEIGCAKGFVVKSLRDEGVDAWGIDVSPYAIGACEPEAVPYLTVGDARTYLTNYHRNEFDYVISLRFMECLTEGEQTTVIDQCDRVAKKNQIHVVDEAPNSSFYIVKPLSQWAAKAGTKKGSWRSQETDQEIVIS